MRRTKVNGFTLLELMLVVLILGILAAFLIPLITGNTDEARRNSLITQLRTLRSQIQIYAVQHNDVAPNLIGANWDDLLQQSPWNQGTLGPYLVSRPKNPVNGYSDVTVVSVNVQGGDPVEEANTGYVYNPSTGQIWATNHTTLLVFNEENPQDPNN